MTKTSDNNETLARNAFNRNLLHILEEIRFSAQTQFNHNLNNNIPNNIAGITLDNAPDHAIRHGIIHAVSKYNSWDINKAIEFAIGVLEDSNAHGEARALADFAEKNNRG